MEFEKWAPTVSKIVYKGLPHIRKDLGQIVKSGTFQVLLTTFEYIIRDKSLLSRVKWLYLVMDEGHRMKNANSKLTVILRKHYQTRYRLILTGTPLQVCMSLFKCVHSDTNGICCLYRITCPNCGLYSILFYRKYSKVSKALKNGSTRHFRIKVYRTR